MAEYETEEQQVEALKQWWADNGKAVILGIVLGLGAIFGWRGWQSHQLSVSEDVSARYSNLMTALADDDDGAAFLQKVAALKSDSSNSSYAAMASLAEARFHVEKNDLDAAADALRWVIDKGTFTEVKSVARLRLARVFNAQDKFDEALSLLDSVDSQAYAGAVDEIRGDIYLRRGDQDAAREAYLRAKGSGTTTLSSQNLQMKIDDLALPSQQASGDGQS